MNISLRKHDIQRDALRRPSNHPIVTNRYTDRDQSGYTGMLVLSAQSTV